MTSAADLINDGALFAGVGDLYNGLSGEESALGLRLLNNLLDIESTQEYTLYNSTEGTITLTVAVAQYLTSLMTTAPPAFIEKMTVVDSSGFTHPMREIGVREWADITWKAQPGRPYQWFYNENAPDATINLWPTPGFAGDVLHVWYGTPLQTFANFNTVLVAPPGFEMYIKTNVGVLLALWFRKTLSADHKAKAREARDMIRESPLKVLAMPVPCDSIRTYYNIYTDNQ